MYHTLTHYNVIELNQSTGAISIVSFEQVCVCVSVSADVFVHLSLSLSLSLSSLVIFESFMIQLWISYKPTSHCCRGRRHGASTIFFRTIWCSLFYCYGQITCVHLLSDSTSHNNN